MTKREALEALCRDADILDLEVVNDVHVSIDSYLADLRVLPQGSIAEFVADRRNPAAAESLVHRSLQAIFELLRHQLAMHGIQGVLQCEEVARFAAREGLVTDARLADLLVELTAYRSRMAHFYTEVTPEELFEIVRSKIGDLQAIADELR